MLGLKLIIMHSDSAYVHIQGSQSQHTLNTYWPSVSNFFDLKSLDVVVNSAPKTHPPTMSKETTDCIITGA